MPLHITSDARSVYLNGASMNRGQVSELLRIWGEEHDFLLRIGAVEAARVIRSLWLDLDLAQPVQWVEDNPVIPKLEPLRCVVRTLNEKLWPAVPFDGAAA